MSHTRIKRKKKKWENPKLASFGDSYKDKLGKKGKSLGFLLSHTLNHLY